MVIVSGSTIADFVVYRRLSAKCVKVARPLLGGYIATRQEFEYYCTKLFGLLTQGKLELRVHKVYDLEGVQQAHKVRDPFALASDAIVLTNLIRISRGGIPQENC